MNVLGTALGIGAAGVKAYDMYDTADKRRKNEV